MEVNLTYWFIVSNLKNIFYLQEDIAVVWNMDGGIIYNNESYVTLKYG